MEKIITKFHKEILELYKEVLNDENINFNDNFFKAGGDSMKAITLMEKINEKYKSKISLTDVLTFITGLELNVYDMASKLFEEIVNNPNDKLTIRHRKETPEKIPLSFAQQGMWIEEIMNGVNHEDNTQRYNVVGTTVIKDKNFKLKEFEEALRKLISETVGLRIYFKVKDYTPLIGIKEFNKEDFHIEIEEYKDLSVKEMINYMEDYEKKYKYEFDKYPLVHFRLGKAKNGEIVFLIATHHLVADAYSVLQLLLQRVEDLYYKRNDKESITNKTEVDYIDYLLWQRKSYDKGYFKKDIEYWKGKLSNDIPILNLSNKESVDWQTCNGGSKIINVNESALNKIKEICQEEAATSYSGFVLAMYIFLYYMFDETDLAVGGTNGGRIYEEFQSIIGNFASIQLLRTKIDPNKSYRELLKDVKNTINGSYLHASLPCGMIMREVGLKQDYFYIPYKIIVNYVDAEIKDRKLFSRFNFSTNALVDFGLSVLQPDGKFELSFLYKENLFEEKEVDNFANIMSKILLEISENPDKAIESYNIMNLE